MPGMMQPRREWTWHEDGTVTVKVWPLFGSKEPSEMTLRITREQWADWQNRGVYIQHAMPHLSAGEREFLMSGLTPEQWDKEFNSGD